MVLMCLHINVILVHDVRETRGIVQSYLPPSLRQWVGVEQLLFEKHCMDLSFRDSAS